MNQEHQRTMDARSIARQLYTALLILSASTLAQATETLRLQISALHQTQFIGYYVASAKGFYQARGLNVEISQAAAATSPWQALIHGEADYVVDNSNAFTAFSQGQPLVALAAIAQQSPAIFIALQRDDIQHIRDFRFHTLRLRPEQPNHALLALLRAHNVAPGDLDLQTAPGQLSALIDGKVDIMNGQSWHEPYQLQQLGIPFRVFAAHEKGIHFYSDLLLTHRQRMLEHPHQVSQFRQASLQGWEYALNHPEEALALLKQQTPATQPLDQLRYELNMLREAIQPAHTPLGSMTLERWFQIAQHLQRLNIIPDTPLPVERFLYHVHPVGNSLTTTLPWKVIATGLVLFSLICAAVAALCYRRLQHSQVKHTQTEHKLRHLSAHDTLTQLPNRTALIEQLTVLLKLAHRHHTTPALFYIDIDGFKAINESLGHKAGDELLVKFANRMRSTLRESDIFGRLGSDEFLLIVDESSEDGASHLAMKLMEQLTKPFLINEQDIKISASIGIARYTDCGETADELIRRADSAMFKVKHSFKAGFSLAHPPAA